MDLAKIQARAGHEDIETTLGYVRLAEAVGGEAFGVPFPPLPESLLGRGAEGSGGGGGSGAGSSPVVWTSFQLAHDSTFEIAPITPWQSGAHSGVRPHVAQGG
ncbi:MAG TPA: hypothetical protein VII66_03240 [Gemmatimonadaceae bacterium]